MGADFRYYAVFSDSESSSLTPYYGAFYGGYGGGYGSERRELPESGYVGCGRLAGAQQLLLDHG